MTTRGGPDAAADHAVDRLDDRGLVAGMQLERDLRAIRPAVAEMQLERERQPVAAELVVVGRVGQQRAAPTTERLDRRAQLASALGQPEQRRRDGGRGLLALDDSRLLELTQSIGEQVRRDPRQAAAQIGVAAGVAQQQLAHDQQRPAVADDVERLGETAELPV